MSLGLKRGTVEIVEYDPSWPHEFASEKEKLFSALGNKLLALEHAGSTAVPGLASKPIIDMVGAIASFDKLDYFIERLQKLDYEYMPDRMFEDRKFFPKGPQANRTHHLSLVIKDDLEQWRDKLLFRDYLRLNKAARNEYAALKKELAQRYSQDREAYTLAKDDFIEQSLITARTL